MIRFQALWNTKSFVKMCLKFKLPLWTKGLLIHLSPLWQLPLWHFPRWHNFPVYTFESKTVTKCLLPENNIQMSILLKQDCENIYLSKPHLNVLEITTCYKHLATDYYPSKGVPCRQQTGY